MQFMCAHLPSPLLNHRLWASFIFVSPKPTRGLSSMLHNCLQPQGAFGKNLVSPGEDSQGTNSITIQPVLAKYCFWGMLFPSLALGILCRLEAMVDNLWATKNHYLNKELDVWHFKVHGHCHHRKNQNCVRFPLILPFITALIVNYIL